MSIHRLEVEQGFFDDDWTAHCSCGWTSKGRDTEMDAVDDWENHCDLVFMKATTEGPETQ